MAILNQKININNFLHEACGVVHVGASIGQERDLYASHGLSVLWIEPIQEIFNILSDKIRPYKNQIAVQALVTDVDGKDYSFNISNNAGKSSSIFELNQHKDIWPKIAYQSKRNITSTTLSTVFKTRQIQEECYNTLIMDTQGSELLVLQGAIPILRNFKFIKTEAADFESYVGNCYLRDINSFMNEYGYTEMCRETQKLKGDGRNYYDVVYRRCDS